MADFLDSFLGTQPDTLDDFLTPPPDADRQIAVEGEQRRLKAHQPELDKIYAEEAAKLKRMENDYEPLGMKRGEVYGADIQGRLEKDAPWLSDEQKQAAAQHFQQQAPRLAQANQMQQAVEEVRSSKGLEEPWWLKAAKVSPFARSGAELGADLPVIAAGKRFEAGQDNWSDRYQLARHLVDMEKEKKRQEEGGFSGQVLDMLSQLPATLAEWYALGGAGELGRAAAGKAGETAIGNIAGALAAGAVRTAADPAAVAAGTARRMVPQVGAEPGGQVRVAPGESLGAALPGAAVQKAIENIAWEAVGGPLNRSRGLMAAVGTPVITTEAQEELSQVVGGPGGTLSRLRNARTDEERESIWKDLAAKAVVFGALGATHKGPEAVRKLASEMRVNFDSIFPQGVEPFPSEPSPDVTARTPLSEPYQAPPTPQEAPQAPPRPPEAPPAPTPPEGGKPWAVTYGAQHEGTETIRPGDFDVVSRHGSQAEAHAEMMRQKQKFPGSGHLFDVQHDPEEPPEAAQPPREHPLVKAGVFEHPEEAAEFDREMAARQGDPKAQAAWVDKYSFDTKAEEKDLLDYARERFGYGRPAPQPPEAPAEQAAGRMSVSDLDRRLRADERPEGLSKREWQVLKDRHLDPDQTFDDLGKKMGVSKQRAQQIHHEALEKLVGAVEPPPTPPPGEEPEPEPEPERVRTGGRVKSSRVPAGVLHTGGVYENPYVRAHEDLINQMMKEMEDAGGKLSPERLRFYEQESLALTNDESANVDKSEALGRAAARRKQGAEPDRGGGPEAGGPGGPDQAEAAGAGPAPAGPEAGARGAGAPEPAGRAGPVAAPPPVRGEAVDPGLRLAKELAGEEGGAVDVSAMTQHARNAYDHLKRMGQFLKDTAGKLAGRQVPATDRLSHKAADSIVRYDASRGLAEEQAKYYPEVVLGKAGVKDEAFARTVGTAILEERARDAKNKLGDRSQESLVAAAELVRKSQAAGITPEEKQRLLDAAARHEAEGKKDAADAGKIITFVGHPDSPFKVEADYQAALANPEVKAATERYDREYVPERERTYRESKGLDQDAEPTITQRDRGTISAYQPEEVSPPPGPGVRGQGYLGNPKVRGLSTSRDASLQGETYETDIRKIIRNDVLERTPKAAKAEMVRALVSEGLAKWGRNGEVGIEFGGKPAVEFPEVAPPPGTQEAQAGQKALFVHPDAAPDVRQVLKVDEAPGRIPYVSRALGAITGASLVGAGGEITTHSGNLLSMLSKVGHNPVDFFRRAYQVITRDPQMQRDWLELTRIGATKRVRGLESGELYESKYNPLTVSGRVLDFIDKTTRLTASDAFDRMAGKKGLLAQILPESMTKRIEDTEQNKRDFMNQVGNYSKGTQNRLVVLLRNSGFGPFATAGSNFTAQGVRAVFGGPGVTATGYGHAAGLRVETYLRMLAPVALGMAYNYARWGRADGDEKTPIGAVKVGENKETGETNYLDVAGIMNPLRRGMRMTGLNAVAEGTRAGASNRSIKGQAWHEALQTASHPFLGPGGQFLYTLGTGKDALGRQVAYQPDEEGSELGENAKAALKGVSPLYSPEEYLRTGQVQKYHEHPFLEQLGPYRVKQSKQPPGHEQKPKGLRRP